MWAFVNKVPCFLQWMRARWTSDPCYAFYGVDGSDCSFLIYLSEVEWFCPPLAWRNHTATPSAKLLSRIQVRQGSKHLASSTTERKCSLVQLFRADLNKVWFLHVCLLWVDPEKKGTVEALGTVHDSKGINHLPRRVEGTFSCFSHKETLAGFVGLYRSFQAIPTLPCVRSVLKEAEPGPRALAFTRSAAICSALIRPAQRLPLGALNIPHCRILESDVSPAVGQLCLYSLICFSRGFLLPVWEKQHACCFCSVCF